MYSNTGIVSEVSGVCEIGPPTVRASENIDSRRRHWSDMAEDIERMSVTLPSELLSSLDGIVDGEEYESRSEATRDALRLLLTEYHRQHNFEGTQRGAIVLLYDHEVDGITDKVLHLQHELSESIIATQHVHLSRRLCMETLVVDGPGTDIRALLDAIRPLKGVRQVKLAVVEAN